jgi:hypothetical protein
MSMLGGSGDSRDSTRGDKGSGRAPAKKEEEANPLNLLKGLLGH